MKTPLMNSDWILHEAPLGWNKKDNDRVLAIDDGWMRCSLHCDVHMPLIDAGIIKDPVLSDYSFDSEWIEKRSWWFVHQFNSEKLDLCVDKIELCIESIDAYGEIFVNGVHVGTHKNAHYPFIRYIKEFKKTGNNTLCILVTTGFEQVSGEDLADFNWAVCHEESKGCPERGDRRCAYVRKPQYTA